MVHLYFLPSSLGLLSTLAPKFSEVSSRSFGICSEFFTIFFYSQIFLAFSALDQISMPKQILYRKIPQRLSLSCDESRILYLPCLRSLNNFKFLPQSHQIYFLPCFQTFFECTQKYFSAFPTFPPRISFYV